MTIKLQPVDSPWNSLVETPLCALVVDDDE
jgi:hypothetical protein